MTPIITRLLDFALINLNPIINKIIELSLSVSYFELLGWDCNFVEFRYYLDNLGSKIEFWEIEFIKKLGC